MDMTNEQSSSSSSSSFSFFTRRMPSSASTTVKARVNTKTQQEKMTKDNVDVVVQENTSTIVSDVIRILSDLVLFFCRRIIFAPVPFKLILYFLVVSVGSILKYYELAPDSYLSLKTNIFNVYFAKLGWGWTIGLLIPFVYLNLRPTHSHRQIFVYHLSRLAIATIIWYIATNFFVVLETYTGRCLHDDFRAAPRRVCLKSGYQWQEGHDISGHTFLFIYTLVIINEEVKSYDQAWRNSKINHGAGDSSRSPLSSMFIFLLYICLAILTIIWELMLVTTALYFHHTLHKLEAVAIAVSLWALTYQFWYTPEMTSMFRPASPKDVLIS